ncbi:internal scaffolding protein [Blackfly microvirus SF02]|uniref:Internal scaffolding protein n=1 Tax=Blackfly microvirus SF02 TaxID=2576452 RepID=A0A4P8PQE3_9VIRU|nr:internal scaffolding protein [Blackfly microvirus SF02]
MSKQIQNELQKKSYPHARTAFDPPYRGDDMDFAGEISLTKQADAQSCDINYIMSQYEKTGLLDHISHHQGQYADLGNALDYHTAMSVIVEAQQSFESLPAEIRRRFANDPAQFLDFVSKDENIEEMAKMGLLTFTKASATPLEDAIDKAPPKPPKGKKPHPNEDTGNLV